MKDFTRRTQDGDIDKRLLQQADMQGSSEKTVEEQAAQAIPTLEQMSEKPTDDENGTMLTTAEIIDFAEGTDTYL